MKTYWALLFAFCTSSVFASDLTRESSQRLLPDTSDLVREMAELKQHIANLTHIINEKAAVVESEWPKTNAHIAAGIGTADNIVLEWQRSNQNFEKAIIIVEERFTVATLVGIGLAVGIAPALVNLACLPIVYLVAKRGYNSAATTQTRS